MVKHGNPPFIECSTRGFKRLSAFWARIRSRGNKPIEEIYQAAKIFEDGTTGLSWRQAKGRQAVNMEAVTKLYSQLWDEYIAENPELLLVLKQASGLSDIFGQLGHVCQATELWRIRGENEPVKEEVIEPKANDNLGVRINATTDTYDEPRSGYRPRSSPKKSVDRISTTASPEDGCEDGSSQLGGGRKRSWGSNQ